jgi:hypothetical protein
MIKNRPAKKESELALAQLNGEIGKLGEFLETSLDDDDISDDLSSSDKN